MTKEEFNTKLKEAGLSKKEFASIIGMEHSSVLNYGGSQDIPRWVESWLDNYIKAQHMDRVAEVVHPYMNKKKDQ